MKKKVENFLHEDTSYKIRGCFFNVYNELGFGHKESIYQKSLEIELEKSGLQFEKQKSLPVKYNNKRVGVYRPDFLVENNVIIEIKSVPILPASHEKQLIYYLKGTGYKLGFIVNFGADRLDIRRRIWSSQYKKNKSV